VEREAGGLRLERKRVQAINAEITQHLGAALRFESVDEAIKEAYPSVQTQEQEKPATRAMAADFDLPTRTMVRSRFTRRRINGFYQTVSIAEMRMRSCAKGVPYSSCK